MAKILVVDDEKIIVKGIRFSLLQDQMEVDCAYDGEQAVEMARNTEYDVVLLDVMLPKLDGFQVCQAIREFSNMPIIMLTAKGDDMDKILGLEYGADDYVTKPFDVDELLARIVAQLRHSQTNSINSILEHEDIRLDLNTRTVSIKNIEVKLTKTEYAILKILMENPKQVITKNILLERISEETPDCMESSLRVHISNLRKKLRDISDREYIEAVWGIGFKMAEE